jgi:hypothetical protein
MEMAERATDLYRKWLNRDTIVSCDLEIFHSTLFLLGGSVDEELHCRRLPMAMPMNYAEHWPVACTVRRTGDDTRCRETVEDHCETPRAAECS